MIVLFSLGLLVAALWAIGPILQKLVLMRGVSSTTIIIIGGIFSIIFGVVCLIFKREDLVADFAKLETDVLALLAFAAIFSGLVASFMFLHLLDNYETYIVNAVVFTSPIFTVLFAFWILGEPITLTSWMGVAVITAGVILTMAGSPPSKLADGGGGEAT